MSALFSKPKTPTVETPKPVDYAAADTAAESARLRERTARGRASTMLSGGQLGEAKTATKTLLGQ